MVEALPSWVARRATFGSSPRVNTACAMKLAGLRKAEPRGLAGQRAAGSLAPSFLPRLTDSDARWPPWC
jgi:hypothetical protein